MKKLNINPFVVASFLLMTNAIALAYFTFNSDMEYSDVHAQDELVNQLYEPLQEEY